MTLAVGDQISMNQVAVELSIGNPTNLTLGDGRIRRLSYQESGSVYLSKCRGKSALDMLVNPFPAAVSCLTTAVSGSGPSASRVVITPSGEIFFFGYNSRVDGGATWGSYILGAFTQQLPNRVFETSDFSYTGRGWWVQVEGGAVDRTNSRPIPGAWYPLSGNLTLENELTLDNPGYINTGTVNFARSPDLPIVKRMFYKLELRRE